MAGRKVQVKWHERPGGMSFTDIAIYTGADSPFSTVVGPVDAATSTVSAPSSTDGNR